MADLTYADGLRRAAEVLSARIKSETVAVDKHKLNGKHYKAREAAHVVRVLNTERLSILAEAQKDGG